MAVPATASSYPVVWQGEGRPSATGKLVLGADAAVLSGVASDRLPVCERLPYAEIETIRVGRARNERLNGERALLVERMDDGMVRIAVLGAGMLGELAILLAALAT
jgi:hypothetical protein